MRYLLLFLIISPLLASVEDMADRYEGPLRFISNHGLSMTARWMTKACVVEKYLKKRKPFHRQVVGFDAQDWARLYVLTTHFFSRPIADLSDLEAFKAGYYPFVEMINFGDVTVREARPLDDNMGTYPWLIKHVKELDIETMAQLEKALKDRLFPVLSMRTRMKRPREESD